MVDEAAADLEVVNAVAAGLAVVIEALAVAVNEVDLVAARPEVVIEHADLVVGLPVAVIELEADLVVGLPVEVIERAAASAVDLLEAVTEPVVASAVGLLAAAAAQPWMATATVALIKTKSIRCPIRCGSLCNHAESPFVQVPRWTISETKCENNSVVPARKVAALALGAATIHGPLIAASIPHPVPFDLVPKIE